MQTILSLVLAKLLFSLIGTGALLIFFTTYKYIIKRKISKENKNILQRLANKEKEDVITFCSVAQFMSIIALIGELIYLFILI